MFIFLKSILKKQKKNPTVIYFKKKAKNHFLKRKISGKIKTRHIESSQNA
jgi:hypothetical protein